MPYRTERLTPEQVEGWGVNNPDKELIGIMPDKFGTFRILYLPKISFEVLKNLRSVKQCYVKDA